MTDTHDELEPFFNTALADYPRSPLPGGFQAAVIARIAAEERTSFTEALKFWRSSDQSASGFLELSSALVMGVLLCAALLMGILLSGLTPEVWTSQMALTLPAVQWVWAVPVLILLAVEMVVVVMMGLNLADS